MRRPPMLAAGLLCLAFLDPAPRAQGRVLVRQDEALKLAFPDAASIEPETRYLSEAQLTRARELAGVAIEREVWTQYTARANGEVVGSAYFDTHTVRSLPETLLVAVAADGSLLRVEVVAFAEPPDYLPKAKWYEQFPGRRLDAELLPRRGIRSVTGATLSARAAIEAVRRVLAVHEVLRQAAPEPGP